MYKKILLVRTDGLGDSILTLPMAYSIHEQRPDWEIGVLCSRQGQVVYINQDCIRHVHLYPLDKETEKEIRDITYDAAIVVHPELGLAKLIYNIGIRERIGTSRRLYSFLFTHRLSFSRRKGHLKEWEYNLNMLPALGLKPIRYPIKIYPDEASVEKVANILKDPGIKDRDKLIAIHAGSKGSALNWSIKHYISLARILGKRGYGVLLTGLGADIAGNESLLNDLPAGVLPFYGKTSISTLSAVLKQVSLFVSGSTGIMHLASIMGTRTLSFFPSFPPCSKERWGCYNEENAHYLVPDIKCPVKRCNKACMYYNCIDGFKHDYVLERIVKIIG